MGYLNAVAGTETAPTVAAPQPSWRLGSPTVETEADEASPELEESWTPENEAKGDPVSTPTERRSDHDESDEGPAPRESKDARRDAVADRPRLRSPRHRPLARSDSTTVVLPEPTGMSALNAPSRQEEVPRRNAPGPASAGLDLPLTTRPPEPTRGGHTQPPASETGRPRVTSIEGPDQIAELRVPADAYPTDLVNSSPRVIRRWLSEHPEIITPEHEETPVGITVEKVVFEQPPHRPVPSEPRDRPQPRGFADYDSIRRR